MWVFDTVGLTVFMAVVGLGAGPGFIAGLQKSGLSLVLVGLVVAVLPHMTAILFGRYILKMNPLILLGACSGAGTITAALRAVQDEAKSKLPALGLHRALCPRQHHTDGVGAGHSGDDGMRQSVNGSS